MKKNWGLTFFCILVNTFQITAQISNAEKAKEANSEATGNFKDVFNDFFQLAIDKITSNSKELKFTSNPYAMMAKLDPNLFNSTDYYRYRHLRKLNFSFTGKLDEAYKFNGFSSSINYAIINKRDETISKSFIVDALNDPNIKEISTLNNELTAYQTKINDINLKNNFSQELIDFRSGQKNYSEMSETFQKAIKEIIDSKNLENIRIAIKDDEFNLQNIAKEKYADIKQTYNNKLLWTASIADTTYNDQFMFSNIVLSTQMLKGIIKPKGSTNLELNILSTLQFTDDSLQVGRDLSKVIWNIEPGLNFVLKEKTSGASFLEFKLSGAYQHNFTKQLPINTNRENITLNGTLRMRVYKDIWLPLVINYSPETSNFFGYLNVRANFSTLNELFK